MLKVTSSASVAFYTALGTSDGTLDPSEAAHALHHAIRAARGEYPTTPSLWTAYIRAGSSTPPPHAFVAPAGHSFSTEILRPGPERAQDGHVPEPVIDPEVPERQRTLLLSDASVLRPPGAPLGRPRFGGRTVRDVGLCQDPGGNVIELP